MLLLLLFHLSFGLLLGFRFLQLLFGCPIPLDCVALHCVICLKYHQESWAINNEKPQIFYPPTPKKHTPTTKRQE